MRALVGFAIAAAVGALLVATPQPAEALSAAQFDPGNIISDANFYNGNAMTESEIQSFLTAASGTCANSNCLAVHRITTTTTNAGFGPCATYQGAPDESAARIIFKVQQACGISAKVLLVTLQKEQGLVTDSAPTSLELRKAMGQGCPDTSECDANYYGLQKQLYFGSRQLTWYGNPQGSFTYIRVGQSNNIQFHPDATCGTGAVVVKNRATAALYYYTPYQPNAAALANLSGTGNACSSYGNRNFWVYYNTWFGGSGNPIGNLEVREAAIGGVHVGGWALDPDSTSPIDVHVYVDGVGTRTTANAPRADVEAAYPGMGSAHGFNVTVPVTSSGSHSVCVYGINVNIGENTLFGCVAITAYGGSPLGYLDNVTATDAGIAVRGWALDPDTTDSIPVHVYVDSASVAVPATGARPDVAAAYGGYGEAHGFLTTIQTSPGVHVVCVYGINTGSGTNVPLGCSTVTVIGEMGRAPVGFIDSAHAIQGGVDVAGWALDPDTAAPIAVHLYIDGASAAYQANESRSDVAAAYPGYGDAHGYSETLKASAGPHQVCAYGINAGPGAHTLLGCVMVTVPVPTGVGEYGRAPIGRLDVVTGMAGGIAVSGWAIDPDTASPITVHLYVDSASAAYPANKSRPDVAGAFPGYGDLHGYSELLAATPGAHQVCAYGINSGPGTHTLIGCSTVTVS